MRCNLEEAFFFHIDHLCVEQDINDVDTAPYLKSFFHA